MKKTILFFFVLCCSFFLSKDCASQELEEIYKLANHYQSLNEQDQVKCLLFIFNRAYLLHQEYQNKQITAVEFNLLKNLLFEIIEKIKLFKPREINGKYNQLIAQENKQAILIDLTKNLNHPIAISIENQFFKNADTASTMFKDFYLTQLWRNAILGAYALDFGNQHQEIADTVYQAMYRTHLLLTKHQPEFLQ